MLLHGHILQSYGSGLELSAQVISCVYMRDAFNLLLTKKTCTKSKPSNSLRPFTSGSCRSRDSKYS